MQEKAGGNLCADAMDAAAVAAAVEAAEAAWN